MTPIAYGWGRFAAFGNRQHVFDRAEGEKGIYVGHDNFVYKRCPVEAVTYGFQWQGSVRGRYTWETTPEQAPGFQKERNMYPIPHEQESILKRSITARWRVLCVALPVLMSLVLAACGARNAAYQGTCAQQTQQFMDSVHALVVDELNPVIEEGVQSGDNAETIKKISDLDSRVSQMETPECNQKAPAVLDALRLYLSETRNYFSVIAGRAVYGEGSVQGQLSKMVEAGYAFEIALEDLRK